MTHNLAVTYFSARSWCWQAGRDLKTWLNERGLWWATSIVVHAIVLSAT